MTQFYAPHGASGTLASGRPLIGGETFDLSAEEAKDPFNKALIDEEKIIEVKEPPKKKEGEK